MRRTTTRVLVVWLLLALVGCGPRPNMRYSTPLETPPVDLRDRARVYFIRPAAIGFAINAAVYDDDAFIGFVPYGQKLPYLAEPGEHRFMVVSEAADFLSAELEAGRTYYIRVVPRMGAWRARFSLAPVTAADLETDRVQSWIERADLIQNGEGADEWARENAPSVTKKKNAYLPKWEAKPAAERPFLAREDGIVGRAR